MNASDIMTSPVISVGPRTPVGEIAALLFENRIGAVPVVDECRLVGMVSEGDLLHRHEIATEPPERAGSWWLRLFGDERSAADYVKSHARLAGDVMTQRVVGVGAETPIAEIAALLETHRIKRVPVLRGGTIIGIVSRANLVQAIAALPHPEKRIHPSSDDAIRGRLLTQLEQHSWWRPTQSSVLVNQGIVRFWGTVDSEDERDAARVAAESIAGVRRVDDRRRLFPPLPPML
jgi:CBS-domain-containing membrane protein